MTMRRIWMGIVGLSLLFVLASCVVYINGQPQMIQIQPSVGGTPGVVITLVPIEIVAVGTVSQTAPVFIPAVTVTPSASEAPTTEAEELPVMAAEVPPIESPTPTPMVTIESPPTSTATAMPIPPTVVRVSPSTPTVVSTVFPARSALAANITGSGIPNQHPDQVDRLANVLITRLTEFNLPDLGITDASMAAALSAPGAGDRLIGLVNEVWTEWLFLSQQQGFNPRSTEASGDVHGLSPFRRLTINMIVGHQGPLADYQQHGLYNYFVRTEQPQVWRDTMDAVIGAVNRESFQWP